MKVYFLGTNGWYTTQTGHTTCVLVETANEYFILDAGSGFFKTEYIIKDAKKPVYLFLSHLHLDHIDGLQVFTKFNWPQGLKILLGEGMKKELLTLMRPPFMGNPDGYKTRVEFFEPAQYHQLPLDIKVLPLVHTVPTNGLRWAKAGKIITYALDTQKCDNLKILAQDADLLMTECSFLPDHQPAANHLTPQEAAQTAKDANAKILALLHFKADDYTTFEDRDRALVAAGFIFPHTLAPYDGDNMEI